mgnify:FL=1
MMNIETSGLYNSKTAQIHSTSSGEQSIVTRQSSGGGLENQQQNLPTDRVTLTFRGSGQTSDVQNSNQQTTYNNRANNNLDIFQNRINETLSAETTETTSTPPEAEVPTEEVNGTIENLESRSLETSRETNLINGSTVTDSAEETTQRLQTVIPIANSNSNSTGAPRVQLTTTGVYTTNSAISYQANLDAPFTVDQTI